MTCEAINHRIEEESVSLIRAIYVGPDGIPRGKAFRPAFLDEILESGIGLTQAQTSVTVFDELPRASNYQPIGEVRIRPDVETFQVLPYLSGHARMLSDLETLDGRPWELCPRSLLKGAVGQLADRGIVIRAAFENEFTIYSDVNGEWRPVDDLNCFSSAAMDVASEYVLPIIDALESQGIQVEKYFPEAGHGQQEIPVRYAEGVAAADQQVCFRETVRGVTTTRGARVSFMPKPEPNSAGNGCHIHLSLWEANAGRNLFYDGSKEFELSDTGRYFTGGILSHIAGLLALTSPTTNSYKRFGERCWSSSCACWGPDNREATVRVASSFRGREESTLNLEYKPADPTTNPYLALAGIIIAGLDGLDKKTDPGKPTLTDPALLGREERESQNLTDYPKTLGAAIDALELDEVLRNALGASRLGDYVTMKRAEIDKIQALGEGGEEIAYRFRF